MSLLALAAAALLLVAGGVPVALAAMRRQAARDARLDALVAPHRPAAPPAAPRRPMLRRLQDGPLRRLAALFGLSLDRAGDHPVRWWLVPVVALPLARAAAGVVAALVGDAAVLATPLLWVQLCRIAYGWMDERHRQALFRQLPDALGMVVRAVRVGIPVAEAIRTVAREAPPETAREFRHIAERLAIGRPIDQAMAETAHRNGVPEYRFFATTLALQSQTGGALGETLDNLAETIRKRVAVRERGYALATEARTSAAILAVLPFLSGLLLAVVNPPYVQVLLFEPDGQRVLAVAAAMLATGIAVMRMMIRRSLA